MAIQSKKTQIGPRVLSSTIGRKFRHNQQRRLLVTQPTATKRHGAALIPKSEISLHPSFSPCHYDYAWSRHPMHLRNVSSLSFSTLSSAANDDDDSLIPASLKNYDFSHQDCNVTPHIASKVGRNLHLQPQHPLNIIRQIIVNYFDHQEHVSGQPKLQHFADLSPIVSTYDNFDSILIPKDHVSRSPSDTYYLNSDTVLRTQTSSHQHSLLQEGHEYFLVTGDVY